MAAARYRPVVDELREHETDGNNEFVLSHPHVPLTGVWGWQVLGAGA
jgi:hypothetical protein